MLLLVFITHGSKSLGQVVTTTDVSTLSITSSPIYPGSTNNVLFAVKVAVTGLSVSVTQLAIQASIAGFFGNGRVYLSAVNSTAFPGFGSTPVASGLSFNTSNTITVTSTTITTGNYYTFFLVADYSYQYGSLPSTIKFSTNAAFINGTYGSAVTGDTYTIAAPLITVTNLTGGLSSNPISYGETGIVLFGFSVTVTGSVTVSQFNLITSGSGGAGSIFTNGKLYRSTTSTTYPTGFTQVSGTSFNFYYGANDTNIGGFTENFPAGTTTVNYFMIADYTGNCPTVTGIQFGISSSQSTTFTVCSNPYATYNPTNSITGTNYNVGAGINWKGSNSSNWSDLSNFTTTCGGSPTSIGSSDVVSIGVSTFTNQPNINSSANASVGQIIFGSAQVATLTVSSGQNLTINNALTTNSGSTPTLTGPGSITLGSSSTSTLGSSITSTAPIINNGIINIPSGFSLSLTSATGTITNANSGTINTTGTGTLTVAGASTNPGLITQGGTGAVTFSSTLDNTNGDIEQTSTGTFTVTGAMTNGTGGVIHQTAGGSLSFGGTLSNTGSISQTSTGTIGVNGALTNNSGGSITLGSGAGTFGGAVTNSSGGSLTFSAGNESVSGDFLNAGIFTGGAGTYNFNSNRTSGFSNSGTMSLSGGTTNTSATTFANTGTFTMSGGALNIPAGTFSNTSPGTFIASAGTVNFTYTGSQAINNTNTTTAVTFNNLTLSGSGAKTLDGSSGTGKFSVLSSGVVTLSGASTTLAAGTGLLTLISNANGSATVAALPSASPISGTVYVQRYLTGGSLTYRGYRMLSSPVADASNASYYNLSYLVGSGSYTSGVAGGGFDVTGSPSIFLYRDDVTPNNSSLNVGNFRAITKINNATAYSIGTVDGGNYNLPIGTGYFYFFRGNNGTVATTVPNNITLSTLGKLNQGQVTYKYWFNGANGVDYTAATGNAAVIGFNMVGNPYASSIDWHTNFGNTTTTTGICCSTNLSPSIYVYNATTKNYSIYTNNSSSSGTATGSAGGSNIIPSGQGFFVRATATGASLIFNESAKVSSQPTTLLLNAAPNPIVDRHIRIQLFKDTINKDETVILFNPLANTAFNEQEDALYLLGNGLVNLSNMTSDNQAVGLNQQPFPSKPQSITLNVIATNDGAYQLNTTEFSNIPKLYNVWLKDAYAKDSVDIRSNASYSFNITHSDTTTFGSKRFSIVIRQNSAYLYQLLTFTGAKVTGGAQLTWTTQNEDTYTGFALQRSTDSGKTFVTLTSFTSTGAGTYSYLDIKPAVGDNQYRLQQTDIDGGITYSNIVDLNYPASAAIATGNINVYPNPAASVLNVAIVTSNNANATYTLTVTTTNGDVVKTYSSPQATWQGNVSDLKAGVYIIKAVNNNDQSIAGISKFIKL